ncbi:MAG TPA: GNAT family N-acetyltransferase [Myxococcota bacterium]|nr:GNAT family N-acetyltransferase [Myxococcota bacterium]
MSLGPMIVRYRAEHGAEVARLQTALWSSDPSENARYFAWKYQRNPWAVDPPRIYVAVRGEEVIGMRGFFESRFEVRTGGPSVSIPLADDLAIRAAERNRGLASRILRSGLSDLAESGCEYVVSLSAGMVTSLSSLALGWKSAVRYEPLERRDAGLAPRIWLRERMARTPLLWRASRSRLLFSRAERNPFARLDAMTGRLELRIEAQPRCDQMAQLVADLPHDGRLRHVRSEPYLAWRFGNPMYEYRFLYAEGTAGLDGYLVLSSRVMGDTEPGRVHLCDLEGRSPRIRAGLLETAIEHCGFADLVVWGVTLRGGERATLLGRGFALSDPRAAVRGHPAALVCSTRNRAPAEWSLCEHPLLDPGSWDLRMLDSMAA